MCLIDDQSAEVGSNKENDNNNVIEIEDNLSPLSSPASAFSLPISRTSVQQTILQDNLTPPPLASVATTSGH